MARFKRRFKRFRRSFKRRRTGKLTRKVNKIARQMKAEIRHVDSGLLSATLSTGAQITHLTHIDQGPDSDERLGNKVHLLKIAIRGLFYGGDAVGNVVRVVVFYDRQSNGLLPADANLFLPTLTPLAPRLWGQQQQYWFIYDKTFALNTSQGPRVWKMKKRINKDQIYGTSTSGSYTNVSKGAVWIYLISDSSAVTHPSFQLCSRVTFTP